MIIQRTQTLISSTATRPVMRAVVVAMAGMIFPAINLLWKKKKIFKSMYLSSDKFSPYMPHFFYFGIPILLSFSFHKKLIQVLHIWMLKYEFYVPRTKLFFEKDHLTFPFMFLSILRTYLSVFSPQWQVHCF